MSEQPWRILLVDDEPLARLRLRQLIEASDAGTSLLHEAANASAALAALDPQTGAAIDLVLLDIGLPGTDGLKVAEAIRRLPEPPAVVFVTAHAEHALRAFELDAVDYLTKPVKRERLQAALLRARQRRGPSPAGASAPMLVVSDRGRVLRVPLAEVLYFKAEQKYVTLVSQHGHWLLDDSLAELEQRLPAGFMRVHRNAVVALTAVRALTRSTEAAQDDEAATPLADGKPAENWQLLLANGEALAVSRRQLAAVRDALAAARPPQAS